MYSRWFQMCCTTKGDYGFLILLARLLFWISFPAAAMKPHDLKQLREECLLAYTSRLQEGSQASYSRKESEGRSCNRGHGGVLLTGLFPMVCSTGFPMQFWTTCLWLAPSTVTWDFPHHISKEDQFPTRCGHRSI